MIRIKKLDIFIAKQFGLLFVGTFFICQFVLMMQFLWRYVDELIGKGLSMEVLAQFFWYMGLMLMPQAFPLAILLSSLITFGNLGESSELTAIKAAGISLMQAFRSLIVIVIIISGVSYYFQDVVMPDANKSFGQLLLSMKQKNPELEIPEGIFYDGIPNCNLYVQKKDMTTGKLYGITIYKMTGGYEDAAIILADSGMLQSTAEKKHLLLTLYSGEWFENMRYQDIAGSASIPYRRETFSTKRIVLDFDGGFNMADVTGISASAKSKSMEKIIHDIDSIREFNDSVAHAYYNDGQYSTFYQPKISKDDSLKAVKRAMTGDVNIDTIFAHQSLEAKQDIVRGAMSTLSSQLTLMSMKGDYSYTLNRQLRTHQIEAIGKITLSLACIIFFFIGAPLGAIIRKGGLGVPVIVSVIVCIIYYIFDNSGSKMARDGIWVIWFGKSIATMVLAPMAIFFTYKANNDSVVFNIEAYLNVIRKIFGLRIKRHIFSKEVIINDPDYHKDADLLKHINDDVTFYAQNHHLLLAPNIIKVFFVTKEDRRIEDIGNRLEDIIEDLSNTKDKFIITEINNYPFMAMNAHTSPFKSNWQNVMTAIILPVGIFYYFRIWRYRLRLLRDLQIIKRTNQRIIERIEDMDKNKTLK